jgi:hypothetical protein
MSDLLPRIPYKSRHCRSCGLEAPPDDLWDVLGYRACPKCDAVWPERLGVRYPGENITPWESFAMQVDLPVSLADHVRRSATVLRPEPKGRIIGITGLKGAGKDAVAAILCKGYGFQRIALADKLKEVACDVFDLSDEQVHGTTEQKETVDPRWNQSPREILQHLGTEGFRAVNDEVWLRYAFRVIRDGGDLPGVPACHNWVIPDVRFPNEAEYIVKNGGEIWRVLRLGLSPGVGSQHSSETAGAGIVATQTIFNHKSLRYLEAAVTMLMEG